MFHKIAGAGVILLLCLALEPRVEACSVHPCGPESFVPRGPVPTNLPGLRWRPRQLRGGEERWQAFELALLDEQGRSVEVSFQRQGDEYELGISKTVLQSNSRYLTRSVNLCADFPEPAEPPAFVTGDGPAPFPAELGTLRMVPSEIEDVNIESGPSCVVSVSARVAELHVELHESATRATLDDRD